LCSLAQAKAITKAGIDTRALTFARAAELCAMLRHGNWRPSGLRSTPEWIAVHRSETRPRVRRRGMTSFNHGASSPPRRTRLSRRGAGAQAPNRLRTDRCVTPVSIDDATRCRD
jgi:hypothetical protein